MKRALWPCFPGPMAVVCVVFSIGCRSAMPENGTLKCGSDPKHSCPPGYYCEPVGHTCWQNSTGPDSGTDAHRSDARDTGGYAGDARPDSATFRDSVAADTVTPSDGMTDGTALDAGRTESAPQPDLATDIFQEDAAQPDLALDEPDAPLKPPGPDAFLVEKDGPIDYGPVVPLDSARADVVVEPPDAALPTDGPVVTACPSGKKDCNGTCIDQTGCCQASECTGACKTCTNHACVSVISQDSPTCAGTCDSTGTCKSKQGQLCTAVAGGCVAGTACSDSICCNSNCSGSCEACDLSGSVGTCTALSAGSTPHNGHAPCGGTGNCAGRCGGNKDGSCTFPTDPCGGGCTGLKYQAPGTCGAGTCALSQPVDCPYVCNSTTGCGGECTPGDKRCNAGVAQQCGTNYYWQNITPNPCQNGGSCVASTGGYTCSCTGGWAGANCNMKFSYLPLPTGCSQTYTMRPPRISGDGTTVVGTATCAGINLAWRWAAATGAIQTLSGSSAALGVNYDGTIICGADDFYAGPAKWIWNGSSYERTQLPNQADALSGIYASANAVSSYGNVVGSDAVDAVRWTIQGTTEKILSGGGGVAMAISRYDEAIAGEYPDNRGFRKLANGSFVALVCASASDAPAVYGISTDGNVVVGGCGADAVRWDASGNRYLLGFQRYAYAANQDGTVIVGGALGGGSISQVFVWSSTSGARNLGTVLAGVPGIPSGTDLVQLSGISSDARIIVGSNNPGGTGEKAWIAYLP